MEERKFRVMLSERTNRQLTAIVGKGKFRSKAEAIEYIIENLGLSFPVECMICGHWALLDEDGVCHQKTCLDEFGKMDSV